MAKRGPLMSAHMKYIPIYQKTIFGTADILSTVDFCLSGKAHQPEINHYFIIIGLSAGKLIGLNLL